MSKKPKHINSICQSNALLHKLTQHVQLIEQLNHTMHQVLPLQFSAHCHLANIKDQTLVIHTDNASFASLIRFQVPTLCKTFSEQLELTIEHIDVKVRPSLLKPSQQQPSPAELPKTAATTLKQAADSIDNAQLSSALEKLASRFKPS